MIPEIEALLEKAQQSLQAAEALQADNYFNFAASRLYYAMFYVAQALLLSRGQSYSSHSAVIAAYGKEFAKTGDLDTRFHRWLLDAQDIRNVGDYSIGEEISAAQCQELVIWANSFLETANTYLAKT
jgi:uncharacterized protein (UPF0332 family)